jgi:hypothetical protein
VIAERLVEPTVVEPADVLDDGELELGAGAPDAIGDQLGLEAVDEALGERVVVSSLGIFVRYVSEISAFGEKNFRGEASNGFPFLKIGAWGPDAREVRTRPAPLP